MLPKPSRTAVVALLSVSAASVVAQRPLVTEAPTGFDGLTNGFVDQATYDADREVFERRFAIAEGLGPVYNGAACGDCHSNPVAGGSSQISNVRAGHFNGVIFIDHVGGSLIADRATNADFQERVLAGNEARSFRLTPMLAGAGFIESIANNTLISISNAQPASMRGQVIQVQVLEANNVLRVARFGWKNQFASLVSASASELLNQVGITSALQPVENSSNGGSMDDGVVDPEDTTDAVQAFARFLRATKAPPRDSVTTAVNAGAFVFNAIGCAVCHRPSITTAPPGTLINGGAFTVPAALGNKQFHPYSDFLLHNVGTGDGIVENGGQTTRNMMRTPPLWGLRVRPRLMHDGLSLTPTDAIFRHAGQATEARNGFQSLTSVQRANLLAFLASL